MLFFIGTIVFGLMMILQSAIFSQIFLLHGTADIVMLTLISWSLSEQIDSVWEWGVISGLMVGLVSELPFWLPVLGFLGIAYLAETIRKNVWQVPLFALFATAAVSTAFFQAITALYLAITGIPVSISEVFNQIMLPSILLNLLMIIPINGLISEVISFLRPDEVDI